MTYQGHFNRGGAFVTVRFSSNFLMRNDSSLTPREKEVLRYIGQGKTSKQIAAALHLSVLTVSNHRRHICKKLGIHSTAHLVAFAVNLTHGR
jgi:DNA-binding CsgD family transcriptional regulator